MKKLIAVLFIFSIIFIGLRANASVLSDALLQINSLKNEIVQLRSKISASALVSSFTQLAPPCNNYGDVNNDGYVNSDDISTIQQSIGGQTTLTPDQKIRADVNHSGTVTSIDITLIKNYIAGTSTTFLVCSSLPSTPVISLPSPVNGGWSVWSDYGACVNGLKPQIRSCTNPAPANGGLACSGSIGKQVSCTVIPTPTPITTYVNISTSVGPNGTIYPVGPVSIASSIGATQKFTITPSAGYTPIVTGCGGSLSGNVYTTASIVNQCTVTATFKPIPPIISTVNGNWSAWANSGSCVNGYQTQIRSCTNPAPVNGGANCSGVSSQQVSCTIIQKYLSSPCGNYGDVNNDGYVNNDDVSLIQQSITGQIILTPDQKIRADVDSSGLVTGVDISLIKNYIAGTSKTSSIFPVCLSPINGGWSEWFNSGVCSNGLKTQTRSCTNPTPAYGGNQCTGDFTRQVNCVDQSTTPGPDTDCNKKDYTVAFILITSKNITKSELDIYKEKLDYLKNRFPWAYNYATGGLSTISIPDDPTILDSDGLMIPGSDGLSLGLSMDKTMKKFYESNGDNFDFVYFFLDKNITMLANGGIAFHLSLRNNIFGIGVELKDDSYVYGSKGRLMGLNNMLYLLDDYEFKNLDYKKEENNFISLKYGSNYGMYVMLHEFAHQWASMVGDKVFNKNPTNVNLGILDNSRMHYYIGLDSPEGTIDPLGAISWTKYNDGSFFYLDNKPDKIIKYHPFTLYFMGLFPESNYDTKFNVLENKNLVDYPSESNENMSSVYKQVSVRDIIARAGLRSCLSNSSSSIPITNSPTPATSPDIVVPTNIIKIGTKSADVKILQNFLGIKADGIYGQGTVTAVKSWQIENNLVGDGILGQKSIQKIQEMNDVR